MPVFNSGCSTVTMVMVMICNVSCLILKENKSICSNLLEYVISQVVTRSASVIRGELHATLVAFDKQWNLALTDVLEVWKRKGPKKRKIPPGLGIPVAKGTAAAISPVPAVLETPLGGGIWECTRHLSQVMVRGEHVVLIHIVER